MTMQFGHCDDETLREFANAWSACQTTTDVTTLLQRQAAAALGSRWFHGMVNIQCNARLRPLPNGSQIDRTEYCHATIVEVCKKIERGWVRFDPNKGTFSGYFTTIISNASKDALDAIISEQRLERRSNPQDRLGALRHGGELTVEDLMLAIEHLKDPLEKRIMTLRATRSLKLSEIAAILKVSYKTARRRNKSAITKIRSMLNQI